MQTTTGTAPVLRGGRAVILRPLGRIFILACAASCLAACTEVVNSVVDSRYAQYNRATDWAKNEAILLNIVRASEYQPLNFLVYNAYSGSATVSAMASSPAFVIGPDRVNSQKQYSFGQGALTASAMGGGSISVQNLDTQDFYDALLSPVDFVNLYEFQRQGYPRELLFRLFTDFVSIKPVSNRQGPASFIIYNDPMREKECVSVPPQVVRHLYPDRPVDPDRDKICFSDLVFFALLSGLTSEVRTASATQPIGGNTKPSTDPAASGAGSAKPNLKPSSTATSNSSAAKPATPEGRLCFDGALANRAQMEWEKLKGLRLPPALKSAVYHPICGVDKWLNALKKGSSSPSPGVEELEVDVKARTGNLVWDIHLLEKHAVEIGTRSTFSIYNFLGRIMRDQDSEINMIIDPLVIAEDPHVLTVFKGQPAGCFVSALFDLGVYCVPIDGAANTKRTFSILSQLLALKTTTGDLQLQPIFRLLPQ